MRDATNECTSVAADSVSSERVQVGVSFLQKYTPGSVLRCPTAAENGVMTKGGCVRGITALSAYNVERVTNTSLSSSCANNGRRGVLDARRRPSRLCFSQFATRTVDNTVDLYAAKLDIRPESRFLPTPPAFDPPGRGVPVGLSPPRLVRKNKNGVATQW